MDAAQAPRAWLQPARPAGASSVAASQAAQGSPSVRNRPRSRSPSLARGATSATSRALVRAPPGAAPSPPPPQASPRGGHSLSGCGMLSEQVGLRQPFPFSPLLPMGTTGQGGAHEERDPASRAPAWRPGGPTRVCGGGGIAASSPAPPSQGLADIFGDISRRLTAARAGSLAKGEGIDPPPPPRGGGGGHGPPQGGGGRSRGHRSTPTPIPRGHRRGQRRRPPQHRWNSTLPSPPGALPGQPRQLLPPYPPKDKRAQRVGGKRRGQPRCPMRTLCDEHKALGCKLCKGHRGVRHCCSRHHEGHPRVLEGGQRCLLVRGGGGGCSSKWALCPLGGRCERRLPRPGEGEGVQQGREQRCYRAGARRSRSAAKEGLRGGHTSRGGCPSAAPRRTGGPGVQ